MTDRRSLKDQTQEATEAIEDDQPNTEPEKGNNRAGSESADQQPTEVPVRETASQIRSRVWGRFAREKRDMAVMGVLRDEMMVEARKAITDREERLRWVYSEIDRMYPPLQPDNVGSANTTMSGQPILTEPVKQGVSDAANPTMSGSDGQIQGLGEIPSDWPTLPANASLSAEVGWVQANRLRVVEERPGRATLIRLDRALSPAPSWAALGWLETSIRAYAKFVDVAAKAAGSSDGEDSWVKRERIAIEDCESIVAEMMEDRAARQPDNVGSAES